MNVIESSIYARDHGTVEVDFSGGVPDPIPPHHSYMRLPDASKKTIEQIQQYIKVSLIKASKEYLKLDTISFDLNNFGKKKSRMKIVA